MSASSASPPPLESSNREAARLACKRVFSVQDISIIGGSCHKFIFVMTSFVVTNTFVVRHACMHTRRYRYTCQKHDELSVQVHACVYLYACVHISALLIMLLTA